MTHTTYRFQDLDSDGGPISSMFMFEDGHLVPLNPRHEKPEDKVFDNFGGIFDKAMVDKALAANTSSTKWVSATIIACAIAITVVVLRYLIKENRQKIPNTYSPLATSDKHQVSPTSDEHIAVTMPPVQPMVSYSQILEETMERFLQDVARERPIRFSHKDINGLTSNLSSFLGSGGYGEVYKGMLPNGDMIAVKVLKNQHSDKKVQEQFMAEVGTLGRTHHENLVKLYGFCFDPAMKALVYEYMENGSLDKLLFDKKKQVQWEKLCQIAIGIAKGLAYLHEYCTPKITHYDIKPGNVLLDSELNPKVADFGLARLCNTESNTGSSQVLMGRRAGTRAYAAPELFNPLASVTNKCDVYSFGLLLLEIICRRKNNVPDASNDSKVVLKSWTWKMLQTGKLSNFLSECGIEEENKEDAERMLMVAFLCVHHDPNERPTMSNVVKMLEGEKEVNPPSYPFEYTESSADPDNLISEAEEKSNAISATKVPDPSHSKLFNGAPEIELAAN